ncbi:MAG: hypothetical protein RR141_00785 [Rikenellaceae bacterium]
MKYLSIIRYILLAVSLLVVVFYFAGIQTEVDTMMNWAYLLLGVSVALALVMPAFNFAKNPQGAARSLIGFVVVVVVLGVAYSMSDATPIVTPAATYDNEVALRLSDTGLFTTYFAFGAALLSIVILEVYNMFK